MTGFYRDRTDGAKAKRAELLNHRRSELASLPHAVRRAYVARSARMSAGTAGIVGGLALLAVNTSAAVETWVGSALPGPTPAVATTVLLFAVIGVAAAYLLGRALAEHRFAVAMSRFVLPSENLDSDVERLAHQRPDDMARHMAAGLERGSVLLPSVATALLAPAITAAGVFAIRAGGYPETTALETYLAEHASALAMAAALGLPFALLARVACDRKWMMRILFSAAAIGAVVTGFAAAATASESVRLAAPLALPLVFLVVAWVARAVRREREHIQAVDPNAGSAVFSLRAAIRRSVCGAKAGFNALRWSNLKAIVQGVRRSRRKQTAVLASVLGATALVYAGQSILTHETANAMEAKIAHAKRGPVEVVPTAIYYPPSNGIVVIDVSFDNTEQKSRALTILGSGLPPGWRADVLVTRDDAPENSPTLWLRMTSGDLAKTLSGHQNSAEFHIENCGQEPLPLDFTVTSRKHDSGENHQVSLSFEPVLSIGNCE